MLALKKPELDEAVKKLLSIYPNANIRTHTGDLSTSAERRKLTQELLDCYPYLNLLINNAGAVYSNYELTPEGIEKTFALNHLGYFHLTIALLPILKRASSAGILNVTSRNHFEGDIHLGYITGHVKKPLITSLKFRSLPFKQKVLFSIMGAHLMSAYSQSKLANVLFTKALASKLVGTSIKVNCIHPGMVRTNIASSLTNPFTRVFWKLAMFLNAIHPEQSAEYILDALKQIDELNLNGTYFEMNKIAEPKSTVYDKNMQQLLWEKSIEWCVL